MLKIKSPKRARLTTKTTSFSHSFAVASTNLNAEVPTATISALIRASVCLTKSG